MKYTNSKLGFSFELPEGWQEQPSVLPPTFTSSEGVIQVKSGNDPAEFYNASGAEGVHGRTRVRVP